MIEGKENILAWFEQTGCNYWSIYGYGKSDSAFTVAQSDRAETATSDRAYNELQRVLGWLNGKYTMAATKENKRSPRTDFKEDILVSKADAMHMGQLPTIGGISGGVSKEEMQAAVVAGIENYKREREHEEMKKEIAALKKDNKELLVQANSPWVELITILKPFAPQLIEGFQRQVAGVPPATGHTANNDHFNNPTQQETMPEDMTDEESRLAAVVAVFQQVAPDEWLTLLEKLASKVQQNPAMINSLKIFL